MKYVKRFKELVKAAKTIVISTHTHPDADGIGSQIALAMALKELGKDVICVNEKPLLERYKYLDPEDVVISHAEYLKSIERDALSISLSSWIPILSPEWEPIWRS